jgi:hypothetical protein
MLQQVGGWRERDGRVIYEYVNHGPRSARRTDTDNTVTVMGVPAHQGVQPRHLPADPAETA